MQQLTKMSGVQLIIGFLIWTTSAQAFPVTTPLNHAVYSVTIDQQGLEQDFFQSEILLVATKEEKRKRRALERRIKRLKKQERRLRQQQRRKAKQQARERDRQRRAQRDAQRSVERQRKRQKRAEQNARRQDASNRRIQAERRRVNSQRRSEIKRQQRAQRQHQARARAEQKRREAYARRKAAQQGRQNPSALNAARIRRAQEERRRSTAQQKAYRRLVKEKQRKYKNLSQAERRRKIAEAQRRLAKSRRLLEKKKRREGQNPLVAETRRKQEAAKRRLEARIRRNQRNNQQATTKRTPTVYYRNLTPKQKRLIRDLKRKKERLQAELRAKQNNRNDVRNKTRQQRLKEILQKRAQAQGRNQQQTTRATTPRRRPLTQAQERRLKALIAKKRRLQAKARELRAKQQNRVQVDQPSRTGATTKRLTRAERRKLLRNRIRALKKARAQLRDKRNNQNGNNTRSLTAEQRARQDWYRKYLQNRKSFVERLNDQRRPSDLKRLRARLEAQRLRRLANKKGQFTNQPTRKKLTRNERLRLLLQQRKEQRVRLSNRKSAASEVLGTNSRNGEVTLAPVTKQKVQRPVQKQEPTRTKRAKLTSTERRALKEAQKQQEKYTKTLKAQQKTVQRNQKKTKQQEKNIKKYSRDITKLKARIDRDKDDSRSKKSVERDRKKLADKQRLLDRSTKALVKLDGGSRGPTLAERRQMQAQLDQASRDLKKLQAQFANKARRREDIKPKSNIAAIDNNVVTPPKMQPPTKQVYKNPSVKTQDQSAASSQTQNNSVRTAPKPNLVFDKYNTNARIALAALDKARSPFVDAKIKSYNKLIVNAGKKWNVDPNLVRAILKEELSHAEPFPRVVDKIGASSTVMPGNLTVGVFGNRRELLKPSYNINKTAEHLSNVSKQLKVLGYTYDPALIGTVYNCGECLETKGNLKSTLHVKNYGYRIREYYKLYGK